MINFFNIKTGERVSLSRPHQIGAYINSSDLSVNAALGQDFGWRLAPEVIVKLDEFRSDTRTLEDIARRIGTDVSELTTIHLVQHISYLDDLGQKIEAQREARTPKFQNAYEDEIARRRAELDREWNEVPADEKPKAPVVTENPVDEDVAAAAPKDELEMPLDLPKEEGKVVLKPALPEEKVPHATPATEPVQTDLEEEVAKKTAATPKKK